MTDADHPSVPSDRDDLDLYDEKVMEETTFYGLPFWHFSAPGSASAFTPYTTTTDAAASSGTRLGRSDREATAVRGANTRPSLGRAC